MRGDLRVQVGDVEFFGHDQAGSGFVIEPRGLSGWLSGVDVRLNKSNIPGKHGSFDSPGLLGDRTVTITGHALADSPYRLDFMGDTLTGLLANGGLGRVTVHLRGVETTATCRLGAATKWEPLDDTTAEFQVTLWCADPRRYGEVRVTSGIPYQTFAAWNAGNFPASPLYTVSGTFPSGYEIRGPNSSRFRVTVPVTPSNPHTVDMSTGVVRIGGSTYTGNGVEVATTWRVGSGSIIDQQLAPIGGTGDGTLTATVTDTFV